MATKSNKKNYRIKVNGSHGNISYITRKDGRVSYFSANETPLALSNLVGDNAAELRFKLEDALDGSRAVAAVRALLTGARDATLI